MKRTPQRIVLLVALYCVVFVASSAIGGLTYFHFANPQNTCASCHEMTSVHSEWSSSAHATVHCRNCHGGAVTLDVHALKSHVNRVVRHLTDEPIAPVKLKAEHVLALHQSCQSCHPQAFAEWQSSRHATNFARIFLDPRQNSVEPPADDCLRCHGHFVEGAIGNVVVKTASNQWTLTNPEMGANPAIPCLTCHQVHAPASPGGRQVVGLYSRREKTHIPAELLPTLVIRKGEQPVKVSRDPRQRVCTQCHAPNAGHQLGTSDDRTPTGVHEGLSCRDCHWTHTNSAQNSCKACHPSDSHCGLDVQKMDTTFLSPDSKHNIHTVACKDCHTAGIPKKTLSVSSN